MTADQTLPMAPAGQAPGLAEPSGFLPERIVHLHPTRRCNLACAHCYSASSPQQAAGLDIQRVRAALPWLRAEGYTQISLSGGEPLAYPALAELVAAAQGEGLRVTMVSNGLLATPRHDALLDRLDGMAISFDGLAERHNAMRGRAGAFAGATAALSRLADRGRRVGAALSVTRDGIAELPDLAEHLVRHGARALQVRPVASAGRAPELAAQLIQGGTDALRLYLVTMALGQELAPHTAVHGDLAPARALWRQREAYAALLADCNQRATARAMRLSDLVNPLVITETGLLKPIAYDMHPAYDLGPLQDGSTGSARPAMRALQALRTLVGRSLAGLAEHPGVVDWFDLLARASAQAPAGISAANPVRDTRVVCSLTPLRRAA